MKNLFVLAVLLGTTLIAGCSLSGTTPTSNSPSSNSGTNSITPKAMNSTNSTQTGSSAHTDGDEHHVSSEE